MLSIIPIRTLEYQSVPRAIADQMVKVVEMYRVTLVSKVLITMVYKKNCKLP